jgi:hypothetical protein
VPRREATGSGRGSWRQAIGPGWVPGIRPTGSAVSCGAAGHGMAREVPGRRPSCRTLTRRPPRCRSSHTGPSLGADLSCPCSRCGPQVPTTRCRSELPVPRVQPQVPTTRCRSELPVGTASGADHQVPVPAARTPGTASGADHQVSVPNCPHPRTHRCRSQGAATYRSRDARPQGPGMGGPRRRLVPIADLAKWASCLSYRDLHRQAGLGWEIG